MSEKKPSRKPKKSRQRHLKAEVIAGTPLLDRRAIEGVIRQMVPTLTDANSAVDAAQQIVYQAFDEATPRRQVALARKALEVSPDCADAYVLLAEHAQSLPEALELYQQGVAAGKRALGEDGFDEYQGHFWGFLETRPYMRAREGLANCLWAAGRREEAAEHCREMLRLNPNDNQGIRYRLASMLLDLERHDELRRLLEQYEEDGTAEWSYTAALLALRQEGASDRARRLLIQAEMTNAYVPAYLAGETPMPRETPSSFAMGSEEEAICYAAQHLPAWKDTPGATAWLRTTLRVPVAAQRKRNRSPWNLVKVALSHLPHNDEIWEVELRAVAPPTERGPNSQQHWILVIATSSTAEPLLMEFFDAHPKDAEIWDCLSTTMQHPQDGDPRRPAEIHVARNTWFHRWRSKLQQIGVTCRLNESLEHVDRLLAEAAPQFEAAQRMASGASSADIGWFEIEALPQRPGEIWEAEMRRLPAWIQVAGEPTRPWVLLVADVSNELILATEIAAEEPGVDWLLRGVWQAICRPAVGEPHLPGVIQVASSEQRDILVVHLEPAGVRCVASGDLKHARRLIGELANHLARDQGPCALLHSPGVTPTQLGSFFGAAADFYRCRPWRDIPGDTILRVACDTFDSGPWYAVVMGQSGVQLGLALYEDLDVLRAILSGEFSDEENARLNSGLSVTYGQAFEMAPEDLDAAEEQGWLVAGPDAYPSVLRVNPGLAVRTPLKWELQLLEGCLRAIPEFLARHADSAQLPVALAGDTLTLQVARLGDERPRRTE